MMSLKGPIGDRDQQPMTNRSPLANATDEMVPTADVRVPLLLGISLTGPIHD